MSTMPKIIELSVELEIQRVSCPGVWLCQDGRVSLTVFALGTSYQTCLLPPMFPLLFKDVFYFRKRFQETCALNNMCCLLKDETIFCELVQWCEDCNSGECTILAQYLGALTDVLFPPNMCSTDGVDLLMRRAKDFPGILSPKIEIATKVRIDEVWNTGCHISQLKTAPCHCAAENDALRMRQVCHTTQYHRSKCSAGGRRPRSRSRSSGSRSCVSLRDTDNCKCPNPLTSVRRRTPARPRSASRPRPGPTYNVYTANTGEAFWPSPGEDLEIEDEGLYDIRPSRSASRPPPVSSSPPRTVRRDYTTEYQDLCARRELRKTSNQSENRDQSATRARSNSLRDRSPQMQERSRPLRERPRIVQERSTPLSARSSPQQAQSSQQQSRSSRPQDRSSRLQERSTHPVERSSLQLQRRPPSLERSMLRQDRSITMQERSPLVQEISSSPQDHRPRVDERKITEKRIPKRGRSASRSRTRQYGVYSVDTGKQPVWPPGLTKDDSDDIRLILDKQHSPIDDHAYQKIQLQSRYIEDSNDRHKIHTYKRIDKPKLKPCICDICKRYHELFHSDTEYGRC